MGPKIGMKKINIHCQALPVSRSLRTLMATLAKTEANIYKTVKDPKNSGITIINETILLAKILNQ